MSNTVQKVSEQFISKLYTFRSTVDLANPVELKYDKKLYTKYSIILEWQGVVGAGQMEVKGANNENGVSFAVKNPSNNADIVLPITEGTGQDYLRNLSGHVDRFLVLSFSGSTAGLVTVSVNFSF